VRRGPPDSVTIFPSFFNEAEAMQPFLEQPPPSTRVLVVDDNADAAESLALLLSVWGHEARVAYDGPGALRLAREERPAVVLLDLGLPGLSGYAVAQRLRQEPGLGQTLLVAVTGSAADGGSHEAGLDLHLTKPVDLDVLRRLLARRHAPTR
jgi:CheY-like chemotaxis protein